MYETIAYTPEGKTIAKLAIADDWSGDWNNPEEFRWIYVFQAHKAEDNGYLIGLTNGKANGNELILFCDPRALETRRFNTTGCLTVKETRPAKKPRRGKRYDWVWERGAWRKQY